MSATTLHAVDRPAFSDSPSRWIPCFTIVVAASRKLGVTTLDELIARARKEPGALNYGSVGIGSSQHLAGEYFAQVANVKLTHVPYRGAGPAMQDPFAHSRNCP